MKSFTRAFKRPLFDGRVTRKEYWLFILSFMLFYFVVIVIYGVAVSLWDATWFIEVLFYLFALIVGIPATGMQIKRLHDTGKSGWWTLLSGVPIASIVILVFMCQKTEMQENKYGPIPRSFHEKSNRAGVKAKENLPHQKPAPNAAGEICFCRKCGGKLHAGDLFCSNCGTKVMREW